jgi:hypothetical protein
MLALQLIKNAKCLGSLSHRFLSEEDTLCNAPDATITEPSSGVSDSSSLDITSMAGKHIV